MTDWKPIQTISDEVNSGKTTARELVEKAFSLIDEYREYNSVISELHERAIKRADEVDAKIRSGQNAGKLAGVPFIAKDNFLAYGADTTASSNILRGFQAPYQATAIERLESEGAICVAKANLDAFAHGGSTENSDFGTTLNPHDPTRVAGGSSGGSAAAVALGIVPFALGSDTGGSIREPASFCGVVGYKPTYGLVSRYGVIAMASSTDVIGPITRSVEDAGYVLDVLAGKDIHDSTTIERQESYIPKEPGAGITVGIVKEFMGDGVDPGVKEQIHRTITTLQSRGVKVKEVSIPSIDMALACYYIIVPAEISSNLSRFDGQRYGYSKKPSEDLMDSYSSTRGIGFNPENKRRIMIGTYVLSSGYYDAYYKKAALVRTKLINEMDKAFDEVDFLVGPVAPTVAPKVGENTDDPLKMYLLDIMTVPINLCGVPAISIPSGVAHGMPVGLQIVAPKSKDAELLSFASTLKEGVK